MRSALYRLIFATLLFLVPTTACADTIFFPNQAIGGGGGTETLTNLTVGPGNVSITGLGNGTDQITGIANINGQMWANNFPGADIGAKVNNAIAALGPKGGTVFLPAGGYEFATTIQCPINADIPVIIQGAGSSTDYASTGTLLAYQGAGDAVSQMATVQNIRGCELRDLTLDGAHVGNNIGFHFGGTIYNRTQNVVIRSFSVGIELENLPDPNQPAGHWTERYDFHQTVFSDCGTEIYFHRNGGNNSFMHGAMDIAAGIFNTQNGIVIDNQGQATGIDFEIDGNMSPDSTGALIKVLGNSYLYGQLTLFTECMGAACTRFDVEPDSHVTGQLFGWLTGPFGDKLPPGADFHTADADNRFIAPIHSTCLGLYDLTPGQTAEMFTVQNWGTWVAGPLAIGSRYAANETSRLYNLAASSCSNNASFTLAHETNYGSGAPFTLTETCRTAAVIGNGTATHPQYPQGSTTYSVTNNTAQPVRLEFSFLNALPDYNGTAIGAGPAECM